MEPLTIENNTKQKNSANKDANILTIFNRGIQSISNYFDPQLNVQEYLNSLPSDTTYINISFRRLTYIPSLMRFINLKELNCSFNRLTEEIEVPQSLEVLICHNNLFGRYLFKNNANIPNLKVLNCSNNNLQYIIEPISIKNHKESQGGFTNTCTLIILPLLPESLEEIDCKYNRIELLCSSYVQNFPNLKRLDCSFNKMKRLLKLPLKMDTLYITNNNFKYYSKYTFNNCSNIECIKHFNSCLKLDIQNAIKKYPIAMKEYYDYYGKTYEFESYLRHESYLKEYESNLKEELEKTEQQFLSEKDVIKKHSKEIDKLKLEISELKTLLKSNIKNNEESNMED